MMILYLEKLLKEWLPAALGHAPVNSDYGTVIQNVLEKETKNLSRDVNSVLVLGREVG